MSISNQLGITPEIAGTFCVSFPILHSLKFFIHMLLNIHVYTIFLGFV